MTTPTLTDADIDAVLRGLIDAGNKLYERIDHIGCHNCGTTGRPDPCDNCAIACAAWQLALNQLDAALAAQREEKARLYVSLELMCRKAESAEAEVARLTQERAARNAIDPVTRLHNLCDHLAEHRAESPYNAEALELADADVRRYQAENAKLRAVVDAAKAYVVGRSNLEWRTLVAALAGAKS